MQHQVLMKACRTSPSWLEETEGLEDVCEGPHAYFLHALMSPQRTKSKFELQFEIWKGARRLDVLV